MRSEQQFEKIHCEALRFIGFHNKNVWIIPAENDYVLSVVEPKPSELPRGVVAIEVGLPLINGDYTIHTEVPSDK
ncbi:hypothetical protein VCHA53O466_140188 [Vibrio chagasii]|nr:hypothetical protein VCHA53O466_140188 [Vibrio chagasii]